MTLRTLLAASALVLALPLALPLAAHAQGTVRGAERGSEAGSDIGGPIGGIVGGAIGAATGTVGGILGLDLQPRFRSYVRERNVRSYDYDGRVAVGTSLPSAGVSYYDVPDEYRVRPGTRYTVVNDRTVFVDRDGRIVDVID